MEEETVTESEKGFLKGIKIKNLSIVLVVLEGIFVIISIACAIITAERYNAVDEMNQKYILMQKDVYDIRDASDFLTSRCRQYVMTGESEYALEYYEEINVTRRRENAIDNVHEELKNVSIHTNHYLDDALEESNNLAKTELHAMALVYNSLDRSGAVPREIAEYGLTNEEKLMPPEQLEQLAHELVFSKSYSSQKATIMDYVDRASDDLLETIREYIEKCSAEYHVASITLKTLLVVCALLFLIIVIALFSLILFPVEHSIAAIQQEETIQYGRGYELNYLAWAYNHLHNNNLQEKLKLKYTAERDSLTKLLNRNGYAEVIKYYSECDEPIALMILDADKFKDVNDGFGHEAGDMALKRIADLLLESFRTEDYIFRYGGDEFVVIMTDVKSQNKAVIESKLRHLNEVLLRENKPDGPQLSLSIGVAFSQHGYSQELFAQADSALYKTKENGRCGFTFYHS